MCEKILSKLDLDKLDCRDKAIVLLAMSSDMSLDTINTLKKRDFLEGINGSYTKIEGDRINDQQLKSYRASIGSFCIWEIEDGAGNIYVTASSPEANKAILEYIEYTIYRNGSIRLDDPLFKMEVPTYGW